MTNTLPQKAVVALTDSVGAIKVVAPEEAFVSVFDRSFHFGDSLYEVTRTYGGVLFSLDEHLVRLEKSARLSYFEEMPDLSLIREMTKKACRAYFQKFGKKSEVYIRITVSRGVGDLYIDRKYSSSPHCYVIVKELDEYPAHLYEKGVHYAISDTRRNLPEALNPAMKSGNYLNNILALCEAKKKGASDAVLLNYQGFVTEGTTNNVFMVKNGEIWSAPFEVGILAGITRDWIYEIAEKNKIPLVEKLYTASDLYAADEMFLSSSTKEVMPITLIDGRPVGKGVPGPVTKKLHQLLRQFIDNYCNDRKIDCLHA